MVLEGDPSWLWNPGQTSPVTNDWKVKEAKRIGSHILALKMLEGVTKSDNIVYIANQ